MRKPAIIFVALAVLIVAWLYSRQNAAVPLVVSGLIEADEVRVGSRVGGRVAGVTAAEGQRVRVGDPLFTLDPFDWQERLAETQAQLAAFQAEHARRKSGYRPEEITQAKAKRDRAAATLEKLVAGPRPREIEIAKERLNIAKANLDLAESEYERVKNLREEASAAKVEYDQALRALNRSRAEVATAEQELAVLEYVTRKEELAEARATLADSEAALKIMEQGFRTEDIAEAAAQVAAAEARVAAIQTQMKELIVLSPCDCVVEAISLRPGDLVPGNAPAVTLLDLARLWVRTYVPESRLGQVRLGQRVPVRVDSFPDRRFMGRITFLASEAEFTPRNVQTPDERSKQVFRAKITLEEGIEMVRVGMGADVLFDEATSP